MLFFCFFHVILDMDQYKSWSYIESGFYKYLDVNVSKKNQLTVFVVTHLC